MGSKTKLTGLRFGRLVATEYIGGSRWQCVCDCGEKTVAWTRNLKNGNTKSCGCLQKEMTSVAKRTHGMTNTSTYNIWRTMKSRCLLETDPNYKNYGGRGIKVCDRWLKSFENFLEDMGERPEGLSLDRIDVNGGYEKSNCRWATDEEQANNRRSNSIIRIGDEEMTLTQWSRKIGISSTTLRSRISAGLSDDEILKSSRVKDSISEDELLSVISLFPNKNRLSGLKEIAKSIQVRPGTLRFHIQRYFENQQLCK